MGMSRGPEQGRTRPEEPGSGVRGIIEELLECLPAARMLPVFRDSVTITWPASGRASTITVTGSEIFANVETVDFHAFLGLDQICRGSMEILFEIAAQETAVDGAAVGKFLAGLPVRELKH